MSAHRAVITTIASAPQGSRALPVRVTAAKKKSRFAALSSTTLGVASWYGAVLDGHRTASGEIFDKDALTACHRTLPFGTLVRVVALGTGRSVIVRINDRGVLAPDRVIDLSSAAADDLGILRAGVARVRLEILGREPRPARLSETDASAVSVPLS